MTRLRLPESSACWYCAAVPPGAGSPVPGLQKASGVLKTMDENELLTFNRLHHLYGEHDRSGAIILESKCTQCDIEVKIEIHPTATGFGMNGGAIHLNKDWQFSTKCLKCHRSSFSATDTECNRFLTWFKL